MGTKNQAMAAKKQQRAKSRKGKKPASVRKLSDSKLQYELATKGIFATAGKYKDLIKDKERGDDLPGNEEVSMQILKLIETFAPIHSAVEVAEILGDEGKIEFTPELIEQVNTLDNFIVKIAEDMTAIRILIEEGQSMTDFVEIYVHLFDNVTETMHFHARAVFDNLLKPNQAIIEEYTKEHKEPGQTDMDYAFEMHDKRIQKVQHLYRTIAQVPVPADFEEEGVDLPQEFIPSGELCDEELDRIEDPAIKDIN